MGQFSFDFALHRIVVSLLSFLLLQSFMISMSSAFSAQTLTVIGSGKVGATLADSILKSGQVGTVLIAARDVAKTKSKLEKMGKSHLTVQECATAIAAASVLILATTSTHSDDALKELVESLGDLSNKTLIDVTNPLSAFANGLQVRWKQGTSAGEYIQSLLPNTKVYKAFNTLGVEHMVNGTGKDMMYAGPDKDIAPIVASVGFRPIYVGPIRYARNLEAIAELWIHCAYPPLTGNYLGSNWTFAVAGKIEE
jgi:8-hydroxy-5-deazaflavin:NADPH oxidoreductase